ncbi:MAG: elongation factor 1-beta, partial [Candidatus Bathyarchaeia archaeon]
MARVVVSLKIFPADIDVNLDALKEKIRSALPSYASIYKFEEEPIAFGLVALIAHVVLPEDLSGGLDEV